MKLGLFSLLWKWPNELGANIGGQMLKHVRKCAHVMLLFVIRDQYCLILSFRLFSFSYGINIGVMYCIVSFYRFLGSSQWVEQLLTVFLSSQVWEEKDSQIYLLTSVFVKFYVNVHSTECLHVEDISLWGDIQFHKGFLVKDFY